MHDTAVKQLPHTQISLCPAGLIQFMLNNSKERKKKKARSEYETTQLILSHTLTRLNNKSRHSVYCQDASCSKRLQDYSTQITPPLVQNSMKNITFKAWKQRNPSEDYLLHSPQTHTQGWRQPLNTSSFNYLLVKNVTELDFSPVPVGGQPVK